MEYEKKYVKLSAFYLYIKNVVFKLVSSFVKILFLSVFKIIFGNLFGNQFGNQFGYPFGYHFRNSFGNPFRTIDTIATWQQKYKLAKQIQIGKTNTNLQHNYNPPK